MSEVAGLSQIVPVGPSVNDAKEGGGEGRVIFFASGGITNEQMFHNGLHQNTLILYDMFESMGYVCYLLMDKQPVKGTLPKGYKFILPEQYIKSEQGRVHAYIEIGMSLDATWRTLLQGWGATVIKLYLGNILNIDVETTTRVRDVFFPHHVSCGHVDRIGTSPHYAMNLSYAATINGLPSDRASVVPYVWDAYFIDSMIPWTPEPRSWIHTDLVIAEPNISFQKCFLYPLLLADQFAKRCPAWKGRVIVQNTERIVKHNAYFQKTLRPSLHLEAQGRLILKERQTVLEMTAENPHAAFVCHQYNNDYNYMTLELMYRGYPVLHNGQAWAEYGYAWTVDRWEEALQTLLDMLQGHAGRSSAYKAQSRQLAWQHSPWNPDLRAEWKRHLTFHTNR